MYWIYILRTSGNTLYVGQTSDLNKRLGEHRGSKTGSKYLRMFTSFELVYSEKFPTRSQAMKRESQLKSLSRFKKDQLISSSQNTP